MPQGESGIFIFRFLGLAIGLLQTLSYCESPQATQKCVSVSCKTVCRSRWLAGGTLVANPVSES